VASAAGLSSVGSQPASQPANFHTGAPAGGGGGGGGGGPPGCKPPKQNLKNTQIFVNTMISTVLCDLRFSLNQPLTSADDWYSGTVETVTKLTNMQIVFLYS
jgi:hypothetical protein